MKFILTIMRVLFNAIAALIIVLIVSVMAAVVSFALIFGGRLGYDASASIHNSIWEQPNGEICTD